MFNDQNLLKVCDMELAFCLKAELETHDLSNLVSFFFSNAIRLISAGS